MCMLGSSVHGVCALYVWVIALERHKSRPCDPHRSRASRPPHLTATPHSHTSGLRLSVWSGVASPSRLCSRTRSPLSLGSVSLLLAADSSFPCKTRRVRRSSSWGSLARSFLAVCSAHFPFYPDAFAPDTPQSYCRRAGGRGASTLGGSGSGIVTAIRRFPLR